MNNSYEVIIIGAGAAGMMCAIEAGKRGRKVLLIDHKKKIGEKIRISGGGRCNFTNTNTNPEKFISANPNFCISALKQYTHKDFIELIKKHKIKFHEKKLGQLFCDNSATEIIEMLIKECEDNSVKLMNETEVLSIQKLREQYLIKTKSCIYEASSLVIASGGLSIPKIGASDFGYKIAKQFNLDIIEPSPGLVPLTFENKSFEKYKLLTGLSIEALISFKDKYFNEGMLFTHRGLSGPSILQISSYYELGKNIQIDLAPNQNVFNILQEKKITNPKQDVTSIISEIMPKRLALTICSELNISGRIADIPKKIIDLISSAINNWQIKPTGNEGYKIAEVTLGGIDTKNLSSKTMMSNSHKGLYFIGEVLDVTGHLGGYNFQWAWSSGYAAGQNV